MADAPQTGFHLEIAQQKKVLRETWTHAGKTNSPDIWRDPRHERYAPPGVKDEGPGPVHWSVAMLMPAGVALGLSLLVKWFVL